MIKRYIVAGCEGTVGKFLHLRLIVELEHLFTGMFPTSWLPAIDVRYYLFTDLIGAGKAAVNILLQFFQKPCFKKLNMFFHSWFSFWLIGGRWENNGVIETLKILISAVNKQNILCVLGNRCSRIIRDCYVKANVKCQFQIDSIFFLCC